MRRCPMCHITALPYGKECCHCTSHKLFSNTEFKIYQLREKAQNQTESILKQIAYIQEESDYRSKCIMDFAQQRVSYIIQAEAYALDPTNCPGPGNPPVFNPLPFIPRDQQQRDDIVDNHQRQAINRSISSPNQNNDHSRHGNRQNQNSNNTNQNKGNKNQYQQPNIQNPQQFPLQHNTNNAENRKAGQNLLSSQLRNERPTCAICTEDFRKENGQHVKLPCSHVFHKECIDLWVTKNPICPICRAPINV